MYICADTNTHVHSFLTVASYPYIVPFFPLTFDGLVRVSTILIFSSSYFIGCVYPISALLVISELEKW